MKETLKLTPEEGRELIWNCNKEFKVIKRDVVDTSRWSIIYGIIVQRVSDNKFFKSSYSVGATESQDEQPYEYDSNAVFEEVVPVEKTIIVYE